MTQLKKTIIAGLSAVLLTAISTGALAQCARAELAGGWKLYTGFFDPASGKFNATMCRLALSQTTDNINLSLSSCFVPGVGNLPITAGILTVQPNCHATGSIAITGLPTMNIEAWFNKDQNSVSGMLYNAPLKIGNAFSGQR